MKKIYKIILLGFLLAPLIGWGQSLTNGGFEANTTYPGTGWTGFGNLASGGSISTVSPRTGSNIFVSKSYTTPNTTPTFVDFLENSNTLTVSTNNYLHIICWAKSSVTSPSTKIAFSASNSSTSFGGVVTTTTMARYSGNIQNTGNASTGLSNTSAKPEIGFLSQNATRTYTLDDAIAYTDATTTSDLTKPSAATAFTNGTITSSSADFSWTAGSDAATGIQNTIILRTTNLSAATPVMNDQGIYSTTGGVNGPNIVSTDWTVISTSVATATLAYTDNTLSAATSYKYAVIHRDLAYNYSAALVSGTLTTATAPTVTTIAASSISVSDATLNGTVNANGFTTNTYFEYGLTTGYGTSLKASPLTASGSTATSTSVSISGLAVNTQYNFRAFASGGSGGTGNGLNATFYTLANTPNTPTVGNATGNSLDVTIGSGDGNPAITVYALQETGGQYVQANGSLGATAVFQTAAVWATKTVTGLLPATTYTFKVIAKNGDGTLTAFGATANATTLNIYLSPASQSFTSFCNGASNNIALTYISGGTVTSPYIELSDASGNFVSNTVSLPSTVVAGSPNTITGAIPAGQALSNLYRIRIVSSDVIPVTSLNNGNDISIISSAVQSVTIGITSGTNPNCAGTSVTFTATPTNGGASPTYQWKNNGADISLATGATYTSSSLAMNDVISCVMTSSIPCITTPTATSNSITMTVNTLPANPANPVVSGTNPSCGATSLKTMAADPNTNFYWQGTVINGQNNTNLTTSPYPVNATGTYYVTALGTNGCWSAGSGSILVTVNTAPSISVQPPATKSISSNGSTSFSITASNAAGFQWQVDQGTGFTNVVDGGVYSGATTNTLVLTSVPLSYTGYVYQCIVKGNTCTDLVSTMVTLTVNDVAWEDFEIGTKTTYPIANITCKAGSWSFNNALIGTSTSDFISGAQSARITSTGDITMNFDLTSGLGVVTIGHGMFGTDADGTWRLEASTNGGSTWTAFVSPTYTSTASTFAYQNITVNIAGTVRFRIVKLSSSSTSNRLNIDNIYITNYTACTAPTTEATFTSFTNVLTTSATINFGSGTGGAGRIVVVKQGSAITGFPTSGVTYSPASSDFSTALPTIATNEKVVYSGTGNSVTVTGLIANTDYYVKIFEYAGSKCYLNSSTGNTGTTTTACNTPATPVTNAVVSLVSGTTASIGWTNGSGSNRLVVVNAGSAVTGIPVNGASYSVNSSYSAAPAFTPGTGKTVYNSTSNTVALTNLTSNTVYYVTVFEFNSPSNCYVSTGATTSFTTNSLLSDIIAAGGESSCISSVVNGTIATVADGTQVWQFTIRDGGASMPDADGVPTIINSIAISQGTSNTVSDWTNIQSAALFNGNTLVATGAITSTKITFTGAPLISVPDNNTTTLSLRITLKNPVSIPSTIDGKLFRFSITEANITVASSGTSGKNTSALVATTDITKDVVCVVATKLVFSSQPSNTGQNLTMSPSVTVTAYDANNNIDLDFTQSVSISSTALAGLTGSPISSNAIAGVASFSGIKHTTLGTYQMTASSVSYSNVVSSNYTISITTTFSQGDFAILALNNNNSTSVDEIAFVVFKDILPGTSFYMTDNGYERAYAGKWGTTEGIVKFTRTGPTVPAGTILNTKGINSTISIYSSCGGLDNANWTISTGASVLTGTSALFDMNDGDQVWFMQGGNWTSAGGGGSAQDGVYSGGNVLYGWSGIAWKTNIGTTPTTWTTKGSRIYPFMRCFSTELNLVTDPGKTKYTGPTDPATRLGWISRINNTTNWTTYADNATYNSTGPDYIGGCITYTVAIGTEVDGKWTGGRSTDWFDCNNWDTRAVPIATTNVNISSTASNPCVVDNVTNTATAILYGNVADCNNLLIDGKTLSTGNATDVINVNGNFALSNSATLNMTGGGTFNLQTGDWSNTASTFISGSGTVSFNSANSQTIEAENYNNLTSTSSGARVLASSGTIGIKNLFTPGTNAYVITGSTVDFNGISTAQSIPGFNFYNVGFRNGGTKTLGASISVQKELTIDNNSSTLALSASNITLLSTNNLTANIAQVPANAVITYGAGKFIIERHLPIDLTAAARRWRLLTAPVKASTAPTINAAWQEGQISPDRTAPVSTTINGIAYGTAITKSTDGTASALIGYDQGSTNNPSIFRYDNAAATIKWASLAATNAGKISDYDAYMIFVRGDRSIVISGTSVPGSPTTLRVKGEINTGNVPITLGANGYQALGNPYASAISFNKVNFNGVIPNTPAGTGKKFYLWDPKLGGSFNVGNFIACESKGDGTYLVEPNSSGYPVDGSFTGTIESGAGFMIPVSVADAGGTFTFTEPCKVSTSSTVGIASRPAVNNNPAKKIDLFITQLYAGKSAVAKLINGVVNAGRADFDNRVDEMDAARLSSFNGSSESISILRDNAKLSIELRKRFDRNDTIFYQLARLRPKSYQLQFIGNNIRPELKAILEDKFTGKSTFIAVNDTTTVAFEVTADSASAASDRFRVVFKKSVRFETIKATNKAKDITVDWKVEEENNISQYEIERSTDGIAFTNIGNELSKGIDANLVYKWLDAAPAPGTYYYRIKAITNTGVIAYSDIAKAEVITGNSPLFVYPNPVINNTIHLYMNNIATGNYAVSLSDNLGRLLFTSQLTHAGGTATKVITPGSRLNSGTYQLKVTGPDKKVNTIKVAVLNN